MKKILIALGAGLLLFTVAGCSTPPPHHQTPLPDPKAFNGHFGDMDPDGNDLVDWQEFKSHFPHAVPGVFNAIDLNKDKKLDHDEWHAFKDAHGLREHD